MESFLQRLLWENAFGVDTFAMRLKAAVPLVDGSQVLIQVKL
jgi:hypothetical protein